MATVHTTARGTEPYDKVYCLGYQVHHEDWSPYPRINKLRQTFLDRGYDVDVERLRLVTESYQQHEHLPEKLKVAYAFENVLLHCGIEIYDCKKQDTHAGGSGCGCSASVLSAFLLKQLSEKKWKRILFVPTGALLSKTSYNEGQSVPGIAHALLLEAV